MPATRRNNDAVETFPCGRLADCNDVGGVASAQVIPDASGDSKGSDRYGMVSRTDSAGEWWDRLGLPIPFGPDLIFADSFEAAGGGCTIGNWDVSSGITEADADVQSPTHRRFSGPCGLRVPVLGGNPAFLRNAFVWRVAFECAFMRFLIRSPGKLRCCRVCNSANHSLT